MEVYNLIFSPFEVNTYILADSSGKCAVIDCSCYTSKEFGQLTDFLEEKNLEPVMLLNTHCHLDHIFGNGMFLEKYGIGTLCHSQEERNWKKAVATARLFGLEMEAPPEPAGLIDDVDSVSFGSVILKVLHVPGHSPGYLAFYYEKGNMIFTGDTLFAGSIGRTDLPGGDYQTIIESIRKKLFVLPPETLVYPGHGRATTIGKEIETNPYFNNGE